jgi:hypothetical protein
MVTQNVHYGTTRRPPADYESEDSPVRSDLLYAGLAVWNVMPGYRRNQEPSLKPTTTR